MNQTEAINLIYPKLEEEIKGCGKEWKIMKNPRYSKEFWVAKCGNPLFYEQDKEEGLIPCKIKFCPSCKSILQTHLNDWKGELGFLVEIIKGRNYDWLENNEVIRFNTYENKKGIVTSHCLSTYLNERIQALEIVIKLIEEKL